MSITNFPMSVTDVAALASLASDKPDPAALVRLIAKAREAKAWLEQLHRVPQPADQPKQPA